MKSLAILSSLFLFSAGAWAVPYQVVEFGNNLQLNTPFGTRVLFGDLGFGDYDAWSIEISLADLKNQFANGDSGANPENEEAKKFRELDDPQLLWNANELFNQGKFHEALAQVNEALRRNENNSRAWIMKGSLFHALGDKDLAKKAWESAQKLDPKNEEIKKIIENYQ